MFYCGVRSNIVQTLKIKNKQKTESAILPNTILDLYCFNYINNKKKEEEKKRPQNNRAKQ